MRKVAFILATIILLTAVCLPAIAIENQTEIHTLSDMTESECISFIEAQGVSIPDELLNIDSLGLFVKNVITCVESNPNYTFVINYKVTLDFANDIKAAVNSFYGNTTIPASISYLNSEYTLQYNEVLGEWDNNYLNYNCYAYALSNYSLIGAECFYYPGQFSNSPFALTQYASTWANYVTADLNTLGYGCILDNLTFSEAISLHENYNVICLRKCSTIGLMDFHFMVLEDNGYWTHKPGQTAPLRFYTRPYLTNWFNEYSYYNVSYEGDRWYTDEIYYFAFADDHAYTTTYAYDDYHLGKFHYYYMQHECLGCGYTYYSWEAQICSGPPCQMHYTSVPNSVVSE